MTGLFLVITLAVCPGIGVSQIATGFDPLRIPTALFLCRALQADPSDSAAFEFEFTDRSDSTNDRISLPGYDSVGRPLFILIHAPLLSDSGDRVYIYAVRFYPTSIGSRVVIAREATAKDSTLAKGDSVMFGSPKEEVLSDIDIAHARELADWLWQRRCKGRDVGDQTDRGASTSWSNASRAH